jgi:hypothetical protein
MQLKQKPVALCFLLDLEEMACELKSLFTTQSKELVSSIVVWCTVDFKHFAHSYLMQTPRCTVVIWKFHFCAILTSPMNSCCFFCTFGNKVCSCRSHKKCFQTQKLTEERTKNVPNAAEKNIEKTKQKAFKESGQSRRAGCCFRHSGESRRCTIKDL